MKLVGSNTVTAVGQRDCAATTQAPHFAATLGGSIAIMAARDEDAPILRA
jgi:hypothetical protein